MGDTITHLETLDQTDSFIEEISRHLEPDGKVVFSFRDLTTELYAEERFIPVKNDDTKIPVSLNIGQNMSWCTTFCMKSKEKNGFKRSALIRNFA